MYACQRIAASEPSIRAHAKAFLAASTQAWGYEFKVKNNLATATALLIENVKDRLEQQEMASQKAATRMQHMLAYIEVHYTEELTVESIAKAGHVSKRECLRCFQKAMGTSPIQYVIGLRIAKAKKLLHQSTLTLLEVSEQCGFQTQSYFTKVFKEQVGETPSKYREA